MTDETAMIEEIEEAAVEAEAENAMEVEGTTGTLIVVRDGIEAMSVMSATAIVEWTLIEIDQHGMCFS
jgi:hypothetical protein